MSGGVYVRVGDRLISHNVESSLLRDESWLLGCPDGFVVLTIV